MKPLADRILVIREEAEETTEGGIVIPGADKLKPEKGKVVDVGSKVEYLKADDRILFGKYSGTEVKVDGTDYLVMREEDAMLLLDKKNPA